MARSSRISSGRTSRVPLGIGWIMVGPGMYWSRRPTRGRRGLGNRDWLGGHALDARAQLAQALVDPLIAAVDLADVADLAGALGAQRGDEHGHAGADVGALHALAVKPARAA